MRKRIPHDDKLLTYVVEYNPLAASLLHQILESDDTIQIIPSEYIQESRNTKKARISVFVLDRGTLPTPLSKLVRFLRFDFRDPRMIVLDHHRSQQDLFRLLSLGIHGFVAYSEVEHDLKRAIHAVSEGHLWISQEILELYIAHANQFFHVTASGGNDLTQREKVIAKLIQQRFSNKEISSILGIRESTVKFHLSNLFMKLGIHDRHSLAEVSVSPPAEQLVLYKSK